MWHDHSIVSGHGHFLVLVAPIFDPAFYYTTDEVQALYGADIDVPSVVENPEVHILARSRSTAGDQAMFNETRRECLLELSKELTTETGVPGKDCLRFFHADGPAAQFVAGNKQGGHFCCVQCGPPLIVLMTYVTAIIHQLTPLLNARSLSFKVQSGRLKQFSKLKVRPIR